MCNLIIHEDCHKIWHQFYRYILKKFGSDLRYTSDIETINKLFKIELVNEWELSKRLTGDEVITTIENYVKRYLKQIELVKCDDAVYGSSLLVLIPHPKHGITVMFIPQTTEIQNQFFLYGNHFQLLIEALQRLKWVYKN